MNPYYEHARMMRWWPVMTALVISAYACVHGPTHTVDTVPARVNPLGDALVIELDEPNWREICVRRPPAVPMFYNCVPIGAIRAALEDRRNADWHAFQVRRIVR